MLFGMTLMLRMIKLFQIFVLVFGDFDLSGSNWFGFSGLVLFVSVMMLFMMVFFVVLGFDGGGCILLSVSNSVVGPVDSSSIGWILERSILLVTESIMLIELGSQLCLLPFFFIDNNLLSFLSLVFCLLSFRTIDFFGSGLTFADVVFFIVIIL